ncbi:MAG: translocation/assembly module TamB domain-containing protein [Deltaproteobacteria bacterium]|nr:translocation/assembly module TamB domain-containing protein [Deltaproteobacteria bacterium]
MSGKHKSLWWKIPLGTLGALLVFVSVALGVALSDYGLNFIRPRALKALNETIRGHVDLAQIKRKGMQITLTGVVVKDPEGRTAATIERVVVHPALGPLLRGEIVLRSFIVTKPQLDLHADPAGLNLARAFETREAKVPEKDTKPPSDKPMRAVIEVLRIEAGVIRYQASQQQPSIVEVKDFDARGRADVLWPGGPITVDLNAGAKVLQPVVASLGFSLAVAPQQGPTHTLRLQTTLENSGLTMSGTFVPDLKSPTIDVQLERAELSPMLANAAMPGSPLITPLNLTGHLAGELREMKTGEAAVDLKLATQGGTIHIVASGNSEPVPNGQAHIESDPLDLSRIVRGAASSSLPFVLDLQARGTALGKITGKLSASLRPGHLAGLKTGPLQIAASMQNERASLERFDVSLPGIDVKATGSAQGVGTVLSRGQASVKLNMQNLQTFARAIAATGLFKAPDLEGSGQVQVEVKGNLLALYARVDARMPMLRVGTTGVHGLQANLQVPSLLNPWLPNLHVTAARIDAGSTRILGVAFDTRPGPDDRLRIDVRARAPVQTSSSAALRWLDPGRSFVLESVALNYPGAEWRSEGPAQIVLSPALQVKHFALRADTQRVAADLGLVDKNVDASVRIANLDLKRLGALAGPAFPASGTISVQLDAKGRMPLPRAKLAVQMQDAAFGVYGPFSGDLTVAHVAPRARGQFSVAGAGAKASGKFNVPARWPWPAQLAAEIDIHAAVPSLQDAVQRLGLKLPVQPRGALVLDVAFAGRARNPTLKVDLRGKGLALDRTRIGDIDLRIVDDGTAPLGATMSLANSDFAKSAEIGLETRLSVGDLLRQKPAQLQASARGKPMRLQADVVGVDLRQVSLTAAQMSPDPKVAPKAQGVAGLVDLKIDLAGTVGEPLGTVDVALTGGRQAEWPATDATLSLSLEPDKVSVQAHAFQKGRNGKQIKLLAFDASANVPVQTRLRPEAWQEATFAVKADVGPLAFQHLAVPDDALGSLRGQVQARFRASGSVSHPQISLDVDAEDLRTSATRIGDAQLGFRYEGDVPSIDLAIEPPAAGKLTFTARTQNPLPWRQATLPGWKPSTVPLTVKFSSQDFSLAAFKGTVKTIRDVQGKLNGNLAFAGTIDKPTFAGSMKLQNGAIDIVEVGRFFDVRMDVQATEDMLKLDALRFKSGKGDGVIRFEAKRTGARGLALAGRVKLDRFPLQTPQRKIGAVFLRATAKGQFNADGLSIATLQIDEAKAFLDGESPKELQKLDFPNDVVFVRNGHPINEDEARKYAKLGPPAPFGAPARTPGKGKRLPLPASAPIVIRIKAPKNLWVYAPEGDIELGLSEDFHIKVDGETTVFGTVLVRRGTVSVLGKRFDLQDGANIRFTGPTAQPMLDVTLQHYVDAARTRIFITLSGTPDDLTIKFRSDPIADESEIITMLLTGSKAGQGSGDPASKGAQAASIVGGLLASKLRDTVLRKLPIDVLSIAATAIEAGTYVTGDLYVGYVRRLAASPWRYENVNAVHLEYQITETWSFEGEYGDAGAGSGDLIWKHRY